MKVGQINLSYIGTKYPTPKGGELTVIGYSENRRGKNIIWHVECSICSEDKELFPEPFKGNKFQMDKGQCPCACSPYRYSEDQNKVRLSRVGLTVKKVDGLTYFVECGERLVCFSGSVSQLMKGKDPTPLVPVKARLKPKKTESQNSNRLRKEKAVKEFYDLARLNGFQVVGGYESAHKKTKVKCNRGHITSPQPAALKYRGWTCFECIRAGGFRAGEYGELYILKKKGEPIYKVGISHKASGRVKDLISKTPFEFDVIGIFNHTNGLEVMSAEKKMHAMFPSAGYSGFDGATEWLIADGSILDIPQKLGLTT